VLVDDAPDPQTRALIEALRLQTAILNERLFAIDLKIGELVARLDARSQ